MYRKYHIIVEAQLQAILEGCLYTIEAKIVMSNQSRKISQVSKSDLRSESFIVLKKIILITSIVRVILRESRGKRLIDSVACLKIIRQINVHDVKL